MKNQIKCRAMHLGVMLYSDRTGKADQYKQVAHLLSIINPDNNPMFFTGLLDVNGKEIYDGDVLAPTDGKEWRFGDKGTVRYETELGGFIVEGKYNKNQHHELLTCDLVLECKVVGNIHGW